MRILRASDYRRMPWKNGGGETREVLVSPPGATLDTLDWRISLATVASDGPFSVFNDIDRTLCVVRGAGIRLQVGDAPPALLMEDSAPYAFDGAAPASATLVNGPIVDLNVMTRRGRCRHTVRRLTLRAELQIELNAATTAIFCQQGEFRCSADGKSNHLAAEDCAVIDSPTRVLDIEAGEHAELILIELFSS